MKELFKNTPLGRSKIPEKPGEYMLLDNHGNYINDEWQTVDNLNKTIQDEHWKLTNFSFIRIKKKKQKIPEWLKEALLEEVKNITEDLKLLEETM